MIQGLTLKFRSTELENIGIIKKVDSLIGEPLPTNILLHGKHGNGKTFAVQNFLSSYHCFHKGEKRCLYIKLSDLLMDLYERDWKSKIKYLRELISQWQVIALDEVDKVKLTEWKEEILFNFFDSRMSKMKNTLITSNLSPAKLAEKLGENIMSRILSECVVIEVKGEVLR